MRRSPTFLSVFTLFIPSFMSGVGCMILLLQPATLFCVYHHSRRQQPTPRFQREIQTRLVSSKASWYRCTLLARSALISAATITHNGAAPINSSPENVVQKALIDLFKRDCPACESPPCRARTK